MRPVHALLACVVASLVTPLAAQRPYFATPPPGSAPTPMEAYGEFGGCPEEPAAFHRCALEKAKTFVPPRTADGRPDLQGHWTRIVARNMENIEEHPEGMDGSGGRSLIVDPADGRIPYQPWAAAKVQGHFATYLNPVSRCLPDAPPKHAYSAGVRRIIQTPSSMFVLGDYAHTYRVIPIDGRPHIPAFLRQYMGDSRGRWEGNTLVVDVTNLRDHMWLDHIGNFYSDAARITERWTLIHPDVMHYQATIDDPRVFTRSWTMVSGLRREADRNFEMWENACWEGVSVREPTNPALKPYRGAFAK
jgi:hypothetical protein